MVDLARPLPAPVPELLGRLLYAVSHDLRSPALTLSLSGELVQDASRPQAAASDPTSARERLDVALHGLREGGRDLERMLGAVTALSRAWHRELEPHTLTLAKLLEGRPLGAVDASALPLAVRVEPTAPTELLTLLAGDPAVTGEAPAPIELSRVGSDAVLRFTPVVELPPVEESPLAALCGSLTAYAGTPLEQAATLQLLLERQGATLQLAAAEARLWLPLAPAPAAVAGVVGREAQ